MAIIYDAILVPGKLDIIGQWLDSQSWAGSGALTQVGSYRFDDPAGEVGIEAMILRRGEGLLHVPMTYRSGPLEGAEDALLGTMEHSVLGRRWVYDATADPVAVGCYARALQGTQEQAVHEIWDGQTMVEAPRPGPRQAPAPPRRCRPRASPCASPGSSTKGWTPRAAWSPLGTAGRTLWLRWSRADGRPPSQRGRGPTAAGRLSAGRGLTAARRVSRGGG